MSKTQYFCPSCGAKGVEDKGASPNGGELYVAEDCESCTECYDAEVTELACKECGFVFYAKAP